MVNKQPRNRIERLTISHIGHQGDGLAKTTQGMVEIPFTLPGEEVMAEITSVKGHLHGAIREIVIRSPSRVSPPCPVFGLCGNCRLQHMDDASAHEWKRGVVNHLLEKNSFELKTGPLFVTPPASRRRVTFAAQKNDAELQFGFHPRESHDIVSIETCAVLKPQLATLIQPLRLMLKDTLSSGQSVTLHATLLHGIMELVFSGASFTSEQTQRLIHWAIQHGIARLFTRPDENAQSQLLLNQTALTARYGGQDVTLPPAPFMQASDETEAAMLACVQPFFESSKQIADLFCGTGLFALNLYEKSKTVLAVDADDSAIEALQASAKNLSGFKTLRRNLFRDPLKAIELKYFDAICLDPPRAGAKEQAVEMARSKASRIAYVSCNPVTFMRDARILADGGFTLTRVDGLDPFLWSHHIELIGLFTR